MLSPAMLRILRWLDEHPSTLESAWDVPRSLSLEGIADGIGVVRSALFQPMSVLEEEGFLLTRQAHVIGEGEGNAKLCTLLNQDATNSIHTKRIFPNDVHDLHQN